MLQELQRIMAEAEAAKARLDQAKYDWWTKDREANVALQEYLAADDAYRKIASSLKGTASAVQWMVNDLAK